MDLYLFDRVEKIIHFDDLSILDDKHKIDGFAEAIMSENEVFVFQLAVVAKTADVIKSICAQGDVEISCINTDVSDKFGNKKTQSVKLDANKIQPLFFTVKAAKLGKRQEKCLITITTEQESCSFEMLFNIISSPVENNGYNDLWRLSRINWLNSDMCIDESVVKPYTSPEITGNHLFVLGREIALGEIGRAHV